MTRPLLSLLLQGGNRFATLHEGWVTAPNHIHQPVAGERRGILHVQLRQSDLQVQTVSLFHGKRIGLVLVLSGDRIDNATQKSTQIAPDHLHHRLRREIPK